MCFKDEWKENCKEGFKGEGKIKMPKMMNGIKIGTVDWVGVT